MTNIKFINRREELGMLRALKSRNYFFLVLRGRRRIGKTTLVLKAIPDAFYFFVWPNKSLEWILEETCRLYNLPKFIRFGDIVNHVLDQGSVIFFDEFQNFLSVEKSVYGELQRLLDERKHRGKPVRMIVSGSSYSLLNKVFNDAASPLYGRKTQELLLDELPAEDLFAALGITLESFIEFWAVFGGVPYYYEIIDPKRSLMDNLKAEIIQNDPSLIEEGKTVLAIEFGGETKTYSTILSGISQGKTKMSELASLFGGKKGEVNKYLDVLRKEYLLIRRITPITKDPNKSREGVYAINDNFLSFWHCFIEDKRSYLEQGRREEVVDFLEKNIGSFVGRAFEKFILYMMRKGYFGEFQKAGREWGKIPPRFNPEKGKDAYEIDIVGLNEQAKEALFAECKWESRVNAHTVARELNGKTAYVDWLRNERKERLAVFAKSFSKRIDELDGKPVSCFDLNDLEKMLREGRRKQRSTSVKQI